MAQKWFIRIPKGCCLRSLCLCVLALLIGLGVSACRQEETVLPFETIEQRDISGTGKEYDDKQPGLMVITTPEEASRLDAIVTPAAQAGIQNLKYDKSFAIAVFQGWRPTTRYSVEIERITRSGNTVAIYAKFREPRPDEERGQLVTSPYHLVRVEKTREWGQANTFNLVVADATVASLSHDVP